MANLSERQTRGILAGVGVGSFVLLITLDVLTEPDEIRPLELLVDAVTVLLTISAAVGVALLALRMQAQHEEKMTLIGDLETARKEGQHWRSKVQSKLNGIKVEMEAQFRLWGMTAAERDVGLLILKGLNHKEIAALRGTSEATVRQQAQSIYQKAELPGKPLSRPISWRTCLRPAPTLTNVRLIHPPTRRGRWAAGQTHAPPERQPQ